jgi:hypothetical protein
MPRTVILLEMLLALLVVLPSVSVQDGSWADRLRQGGWSAVELASARTQAKPDLEALAAGRDAEVAWWAGAALADLEAREKAGSAQAPPLRVTLAARDRSGTDLLADLLALGGRKGVEFPEGDRLVTVAFKETPYLQALDEVLRQSNLILTRGAGGRLQAITAEPPGGPRFYHAGYGVSVLSLVRRTDATFKGPPVSQVNAQLLLRGDPGFRILDTEADCVVVRAEDDQGHSLLREVEESSKSMVRLRGHAEGGAVAMITLGTPAPGARRIALLRGTSTLTLARSSTEILLEDLGKKPSQEREVGGVKAQLRKVERTGEDIRVEMELTGAEGTRWPDADALILEDAEGRPLHRAASSFNTSGISAVYRMTYRATDTVGPFERLRITVVTETYPRKVYFELKDLVLR